LPNISLISQLEGEMKDAVLELITSYENTISSVEELITASYFAPAASDGDLGEIDEEREELTRSLAETLARNCSLRRKDFNKLMGRILSVSQSKKREIENERKTVGQMLRGHLDEQKELAASARKQLIRFTREDGNKNSLEAIIGELKAAYRNKGELVFAELRNFQRRLEAFHKEQKEINHRMQRLVDRGALLRLEDLRQLEAARARRGRKAEKELRREDVERLLAHFNQQRGWSSRQRRP